MSENAVINFIERKREYNRENQLHLNFSELVGLGGNDYFRYYLQVSYNVNTGNFSLTHPIRCRGSGKIYPAKDCGKIDLEDIPPEIVSRYEGYRKTDSLKQIIKRRLFREAKLALKNSRSSRKLLIRSKLSSSNTFQSSLWSYTPSGW